MTVRWFETLNPESQTRSNAFPWTKVVVFWLKFDWSLFLVVRLTKSQHLFRLLLGSEQMTKRFLNHWWPSLLLRLCVTWPQWIKHEGCDNSYRIDSSQWRIEDWIRTSHSYFIMTAHNIYQIWKGIIVLVYCPTSCLQQFLLFTYRLTGEAHVIKSFLLIPRYFPW